jgi:hypothetical protein
MDERKSGLQAGATDDLHVNSELAAVVIDDQNTDRAAARLEGLLETRPQVGLLNDGEGLLDITSIGHGNKGTVLHVENTVALEDRALHGLDNNAGGWVADAGALLMQLLAEEVNTQVAMLASGSGGADADDLARAVLKHEDIAKADVVAGNSDRLGHKRSGSVIADGLTVAVGGGVMTLDVLAAILVVVTHLVLLLLGSGLVDSGVNGYVAHRALGVGTGLLRRVDDLVNVTGGLGRVGRIGDRSVNDGRVGVGGLLGLEGASAYRTANAGCLATVGLGGSGNVNVDGGSRI